MNINFEDYINSCLSHLHKHYKHPDYKKTVDFLKESKKIYRNPISSEENSLFIMWYMSPEYSSAAVKKYYQELFRKRRVKIAEIVMNKLNKDFDNE